VCDKCEGSGETPPDAPKGVVDHAMALAQDAQSRGAALVGDAKEQVTSTAEGHRETIAGQASDVAEAIHQAGQLTGIQVGAAMAAGFGAVRLGNVAVAGADGRQEWSPR
jgi:hypothetical protein